MNKSGVDKTYFSLIKLKFNQQIDMKTLGMNVGNSRSCNIVLTMVTKAVCI